MNQSGAPLIVSSQEEVVSLSTSSETPFTSLAKNHSLYQAGPAVTKNIATWMTSKLQWQSADENAKIYQMLELSDKIIIIKIRQQTFSWNKFFLKNRKSQQKIDVIRNNQIEKYNN